MGDAEYIHAFQKVIMPIAMEFAPELVISTCLRSRDNSTCLLIFRPVSAGFDAAEGDDLGECRVSPTGYAHMTHMLAGLAGGKLVVALEVGSPPTGRRMVNKTMRAGWVQPRLHQQICLGCDQGHTWLRAPGVGAHGGE